MRLLPRCALLGITVASAARALGAQEADSATVRVGTLMLSVQPLADGSVALTVRRDGRRRADSFDADSVTLWLDLSVTLFGPDDDQVRRGNVISSRRSGPMLGRATRVTVEQEGSAIKRSFSIGDVATELDRVAFDTLARVLTRAADHARTLAHRERAIACATGDEERAAPQAEPFLEFQVDRLPIPYPGSLVPRVPRALLHDGARGEVLTQFIVDSTGLVRPQSLTVLSSSDTASVSAVRDAVFAARFLPARLCGRPVAVVMQKQFSFRADVK